MPSMTTGQSAYPSSLPLTQEPASPTAPVPAEADVIPLQSGRSAPLPPPPPPPADADYIPLQTGRRSTSAPAPADALIPLQTGRTISVPQESPIGEEIDAKEESAPPPVIRDLGAQTEQTKADIGAGLGQIGSGDILGGLGTIKDAAGAQMTAQGGDIFPWRRMTTNAIVEEWRNGEPASDASLPDRFKDALLTGTGDADPFVRFMDEDRERTNTLLEEGYTSSGGTYTEPGPAAVWEAFVDPKPGWQRAILDVAYDPSNIVSLPAGAIGGATKAPKAVQVGARALDAATSLGLSEVIPLSTKGLGAGLKKVGILAPTNAQVARDTAEAAGEAAGAIGAARREAGMVGSTTKAVEKNGNVTTLRDPTGSLTDIVYQTQKKGGTTVITGIIDDPATGATRPVTTADFDVILAHQRNLGWDDFGAVRDDAYRSMFDWRDPATGTRQSYLQALDPEIGTPIPGSVDAWNRYRGMMVGRMKAMDATNPDLPVLRSLLADWDQGNTHFIDVHGLSASERRLSAIQKMADEAGISANPLAQQMLSEARSRLRTGPMDIIGQEVLDARGNLGPISRASQHSLRAQQAFDPADFYKQIGTINGRGLKNLLSAKNALTITSSRDLALSTRYENLMQVMAHRFAQYGEQEAIAMGQWFSKQIPKGTASNPTVDAMLEALNASGTLSRHVSTAQDAVAAINALAKAGRAPWPTLPAGIVPTPTSSLSPKASLAPANMYATTMEQAVGAPLGKEMTDLGEMEHTFGGVTKKTWQTLIEEQDTLERLRALAQTAQSRTLTAKEQDALKRGLNSLHDYAEFNNLKTGRHLTGEHLAGWTDDQVDAVAARRAQRFVEQAQGLVDASGQAIDPAYYRGMAGRVLKAYDAFAGYRRTMALYSTTRGPAYILMQAIGNAITLGIARPAALRRYTPATAADIRKFNKAMAEGLDTLPLPRALATRDALGLPPVASLGSVSRDQVGAKTAFNKSGNPIIRGLGKVAAPQIIKDFADSFDTALRHAVYSTVMEPAYAALKWTLPDDIERAVRSVATTTSSPLGIGRAQIDAALENLPDQFTGVQLRDALLEASGGRDAPFYHERFQAIDRASRDYLNQVRTLDKAALAEVDRVGFDFKETRADAVLSRAFMFHYWMSRASVLYLNEAARNPWQAQLWARAMNAGKRKMEETGAPTWQRDLQSFLSTPAGYTGFWNPMYLVSSYLLGSNYEPSSPTADLTPVGRFLGDTPFINDTMLNPLLQAAIYVLGAGGPDFRPPDVLGTNKWTNDLNAWLDKANLDWKTFHAEQGKPVDVPNLDARSVLSWAAQQVNNRGWDTSFFGLEPAKPYDADRNTQANLAYGIMDQIVAQNPGLDYTTEEGAAEIASMVEEALANPGSEQYQQALRTNVDMQLQASGSGMAPLDLVTGAAKHLLPFGLTSSMDSRDAAGRRKNLDAQTALDAAMGEMIYDTPEGMAYWNAANAMWNTGTPKQQKIGEMYQGIQGGTVDVVLDGREWTAEELAALPAEDRDTLAKYWMDLNGYWGERQAMFDASDAIRAENPDMANMSALKDYATSYPTGERGFIEDTRRLNPNYNRYVEGLQAALDAGKITDEEFLDKATNSVAYTAIAGIKTSRFDYDPITTGKGRVAGLAEGETLAGWKAEQGTGQNVESSSAFAEKQETLTKELGTFMEIQQRLNQIDAYYGNQPGTTAQRYAAQLARGVEYIDDDIYDLLKADGFSVSEINPKGDDTQLGWYLKWARQQMPGADLSPDAYWNAQNLTYRKKQVDRINGGIESVDTATVTGQDFSQQIAGAVQTMPSSAIVIRPTSLRKDPGGAARLHVPPGLPVTPGQMARGSDGSMWIYVTTGFTTDGGWVLATDLQAA